MVGGWSPPPGAKKRRRSFCHHQMGPTPCWDENRNRARNHFLPHHPTPLLLGHGGRPSWQSPRRGAARQPPPSLHRSFGEGRDALLRFSAPLKSTTFQSAPTDPSASLETAPRCVGKPTTSSFVVLMAKPGNRIFFSFRPGRGPNRNETEAQSFSLGLGCSLFSVLKQKNNGLALAGRNGRFHGGNSLGNTAS